MSVRLPVTLSTVAKGYILWQKCPNKRMGNVSLEIQFATLYTDPIPQTPYLLYHRRRCHDLPSGESIKICLSLRYLFPCLHLTFTWNEWKCKKGKCGTKMQGRKM